MNRIIDSVEEYIKARPWLEAALYFFASLTLAGILVWYFLYSGFGAPPEFVYNQF